MPIRQGYLAETLDDGAFIVGYSFASEGLLISAADAVGESDSGPPLSGVSLHAFPITSAGAIRAGYINKGLFDEVYNRIYVIPTEIELGNLGTGQVRTIFVWNAWLTQRLLTSVDLVDGEGLTVSLPGALPLAFAATQAREIELEVAISGPATIDAQLVLTFFGLGSYVVTITGSRMLPWPLPPDWKNGIDESLEWLTDVQQAIRGNQDTTPCRETPRRSWEFDLVADRRERRVIENMLYDWTARIWALPVWTDVEWLTAPLALGATEILLDTADLDYYEGGQALLWSDVQNYELVEIGSILPDRLVFERPTLKAWPAGARIYPCRLSRLLEAPQIARKNDQVITARAHFEADEPCDWPAQAPAAVYLGIPVLEHRSNESEDPRAEFPRQLTILDGGVGLKDVADLSNVAWQGQSHAWRLYGRAERAAHRRLMYWLQGRARALWLPTWSDDLELVEPTNAIGETLTVAWSGVARYLHQQAGRRHLRIELTDGRVFYRKASAAEEVDETREHVLLDVALGEVVTPAQVRLICWMVLSSLSDDRVEIAHATDSHGVADVRVTFVATPIEEPA